MALTKHRPGSVRELLTVSLPLMLSSFCLLAMVFTDRVFLAHFSPEAMNASVTAGTAAWAVAGGMLIFGGMAEVYVSQYNGAGQIERLGQPVWQMIWFSLGSVLLFLPIGIWGGPLLFKGSGNIALETDYFFWWMALGFTWPLLSAVSAFFVGQGKTTLIMGLSILANGINILLDWLFVFGVEGWLEPMGVRGAAIATNVGNLVQVVILIGLFLSAKNRKIHRTGEIGLKPALFWGCVKIGTPQACLYCFEVMGFAIFYMMIGHVSAVEVFLAGICQSVLILLFFVNEGLSRGAIAVAGNYLGAGEPKRIFQVCWSGIKIVISFILLVSIFFVMFPDPVIKIFLKDSLVMDGVEVTPELLASMRSTLEVTLILCLLYVLFDGVRWVASGVLTAAGDTFFLMVSGVAALPLCLLLPTYWFVEKLHYGTFVGFIISVLFVLLLAVMNVWRLLSNRWSRIDLLAPEGRDTGSEQEISSAG